MVRSIKYIAILVFLYTFCGYAQTTNRIVYEGWLDSLATVSPFEDSIIAVIDDNLSIGDSVYTEDLRTPVSSIRLPGSGAPTVTQYVGGSVLEFPTSADASIYFEFQMPHGRDEDSNINIHLHYALSANASAGDSVRWIISYSWSNIDGAIPEPTTVNYTPVLTDKVDSTHYIDYIVTINGTGKTYSSVLLCSLRRDVSEDNYAGSIYLMTLDAHFSQKDIIYRRD